mgnify:CR=1 FL=1
MHGGPPAKAGAVTDGCASLDRNRIGPIMAAASLYLDQEGGIPSAYSRSNLSTRNHIQIEVRQGSLDPGHPLSDRRHREPRSIGRVFAMKMIRIDQVGDITTSDPGHFRPTAAPEWCASLTGRREARSRSAPASEYALPPPREEERTPAPRASRHRPPRRRTP